MSDQMAEKKKIELEEFLKGKNSELNVNDVDKCPLCNTLVRNFLYMNAPALRYGWMECTNCGVVFTPKSVRDLKLESLGNRETFITPENMNN